MIMWYIKNVHKNVDKSVYKNVLKVYIKECMGRSSIVAM